MIKSIFRVFEITAVCAGYECIENCYTYIFLIYPPSKYTQNRFQTNFGTSRIENIGYR